MKIEFDHHKAQANLKKHGVTFDEAKSGLFDANALVREDPDAQGEARFVLIGLSARARLLTVIYALPDDETIRLISARLSTTTEAQYYAR